MKTGACFCRAIRYEVAGEPRFETNCHCSICRRTSAAPFVTWFTVLQDEYRLLQGRPRELRSSEHGTRTFCSDCGTPLTFCTSQYPEYIDITSCSLDSPEEVPPKDNTRVSARLDWLREYHTLPEFIETRELGHSSDPAEDN